MITLCILSVNGWIFNTKIIHFNKIEIALKYQRHAKNYKESLAQDITPFCLQLRKKAAINAISPYFDNQWNNVLNFAETVKAIVEGSKQDFERDK